MRLQRSVRIGLLGHSYATVLLIVGMTLLVEMQSATAASAGDTVSHFGQSPQLTGTPQQCNEAIRTWLLGGVSNMVADLKKLGDDRRLSDESVRVFRQRLRSDESLGTPVEIAVINAEDRIKASEELIRKPGIDAPIRQQSEDNLQDTKTQLKALLLNKERVAIVRQKLVDLGKTCQYWELFWRTTTPARGVEDTRRQMRGLIEKEQVKFLEWVGSEQGLNE